MFIGAALCIYAMFLFIIDLPQQIDFVGPFVLFVFGVFLFLGPGKLLSASAERRARFRSYLDTNPRAQELETRSKWFERFGFALFAFAVLCWLLGASSNNWIWIFFAILGLGLGLYRDFVTVVGQYKASRENPDKPAGQ